MNSTPKKYFFSSRREKPRPPFFSRPKTPSPPPRYSKPAYAQSLSNECNECINLFNEHKIIDLSSTLRQKLRDLHPDKNNKDPIKEEIYKKLTECKNYLENEDELCKKYFENKNFKRREV